MAVGDRAEPALAVSALRRNVAHSESFQLPIPGRPFRTARRSVSPSSSPPARWAISQTLPVLAYPARRTAVHRPASEARVAPPDSEARQGVPAPLGAAARKWETAPSGSTEAYKTSEARVLPMPIAARFNASRILEPSCPATR